MFSTKNPMLAVCTVIVFALQGCSSPAPRAAPPQATTTSAPTSDGTANTETTNRPDTQQNPDSTALPNNAVTCTDASANPPPADANFFETERALIKEMENDKGDHWNSVAPVGSASHGRITIGLATRDPNVIQDILDLVDPALICFELPPLGYENLPNEPARWVIVEEPSPESTTIEVMIEDVHDDCGHDPAGRVLPPEITYTTSGIDITIELEKLIPGRGYSCQGFGPTPYTIELAEPAGGRTITGTFLVAELGD